MFSLTFPGPSHSTRRPLYYGWVIVAAVTLLIGVTYGMMYSYSVFFKPLCAYFNWDRATVSLVYSASVIIRGASSIGAGWLADRYGARSVMVGCGLLIGLGLVLSSQVNSLWQFFLTYGLIEAIGQSGAFGIGTSLVSRWFTHNRGLAIGLSSIGSGLGTLFIVPGNERLISALDWSGAFLVCGVVGGILAIAAALLLRPAPPAVIQVAPAAAAGAASSSSTTTHREGETNGLRQALRDSRMIIFLLSLLLFFFGVQIIMVHLVNYATDSGINPLTAATLISLIGAISIGGRLATGVGADRLGIQNMLALTCLILLLSFLCLIFLKSLWSFYLFAVIFGICYGGEIPQITLFISQYWGTGRLATLVGFNIFITSIGSALGPWTAGKIYDATQSYQGAFIAGAAAALVSLCLVVILRFKTRQKGENPNRPG